MTDIELAEKAGFDTDLPVFKNGDAIALRLIELVRMDERINAMAAILEECPKDGSDAEIILRRAWDRVRRMRSNAPGKPTAANEPKKG